MTDDRGLMTVCGTMMTSEQFDRARQLTLRLAGIELFPRHRGVLEGRLRRCGIRDTPGIDALLGGVGEGEAAAVRRFVGLVTTTFTGFFRHAGQFDLAAEHALWAAHRRGEARLWSAAAATGEEPYSLAMALIEVFRREDPPVSVLATDINEEALEVASRGEYGPEALAPVTGERRTRWLVDCAAAAGVPPPRQGRRQMVPAVRRLVEFRALNLVDPVWPVGGPFDVIFCRNVLMYLDPDRRHMVLERMASLLAADGVLFIDPVEHPGTAGACYAPVRQGILSLRPARPSGQTARASAFREPHFSMP